MENIAETAENKIMILFALERSGAYTTENRFINSILEMSLMNYFVLRESIGELIKDKLAAQIINEGRSCYTITDEGGRILEYFNDKVHKGIKRRIIKAMEEMQKKKELDSMVIAEFREIDVDVFEVELVIRERAAELMNLRMITGTKNEAIKLCDIFKKKYQDAYTHILGFFIENT